MMTSPFSNPFSWNRHAGSFVKNSNAELPTSTPYAEIASQINSLTVPQTAPPIPTVGNAASGMTVDENGMRWLTFENSHGDWKDSEINSPPEEFLARKDLERQEIERQKMMGNLTDEQKKLLAMVDAGLLNSPSALEEE